MYSRGADLAAEVYVTHGLDVTDATAAGSGDNTAANGRSIDLTTFLPRRFLSLCFAITAKAVLTATRTLTVTAKIQESANGSDWTDVVAAQTVLTLTGGSGGTTERGGAKIGVDLAKVRRYVRVVVTPDLSHSGTDTAELAAAAVFGGADQLPI